MIGQLLRKQPNFLMLLNTQLKWHKTFEKNRVFWQSQTGIQEKKRKKQRWKWNNFVKEMMWVAYALGRRIACLLSLKMEESRKCQRDCCCQSSRRFTNILDRKPSSESWILYICHATTKVVCTSGIIWDIQYM